MRKKLNVVIWTGAYHQYDNIDWLWSGENKEKNPYEGKWVAVSAQMMGMSVSIDETFGVLNLK